MYNDAKLEKLLRETGAQGDASEKIRKAAESNPALAEALGRLTDRDIAGISALLSDREALSRLMAAPKAQALLRKLKG